jgi:hypothetical protein
VIFINEILRSFVQKKVNLYLRSYQKKKVLNLQIEESTLIDILKKINIKI